MCMEIKERKRLRDVERGEASANKKRASQGSIGRKLALRRTERGPWGSRECRARSYALAPTWLKVRTSLLHRRETLDVQGGRGKKGGGAAETPCGQCIALQSRSGRRSLRTSGGEWGNLR